MNEGEDLIINTKIDMDYADAQRKIDRLKQMLDDATKDRTVRVNVEEGSSEEGTGNDDGGEGGNSFGENVVDSLDNITKILEDIRELVRSMIKTPSTSPNPGTPGGGGRRNPWWWRRRNIGEGEESEGEGRKKKKSSGGNIFDSIGKGLSGILGKFASFFAFAKAFSMFSSYLHKVLIWNQEFRQVMADLKGAVLTLIQPIIEFVVPILIKVIRVLTAIITSLGRMLASAFGKSFGQMTKNAEKLYNTVKNINKTVADYDELSVINSSEIYPSFDFASAITEEIMKLELVAGIAMIALGLILLFSGFPAVGIALIAAGAAAIADLSQQQGEGWIKEQLTTWIEEYGEIITGAAIALLLLGVILLFTGNIPLGIALVIVGAGILYAEKELNGQALKETLTGFVEEYGEYIVGAGALLIVFGLLISLAGRIGLGIAMVVAGATLLYVSYELSPGTVKEIVVGFVEEYGEYILGAGALLIVLGLLICLCGNLPLGIGMMIIGAGLIAAVAAITPQAVMELITKFVEEYGEYIAYGAFALIVIGIILLITGSIVLGLALIIAGAGMLYAVASMNPAAIREILSGETGKWIAIIAAAVLAIGVILILCGFIPLGIAMVILGAGVLTAAAIVNWNKIKDKVKTVLSEILGIVGMAMIAIGVILLLTGVGIGMGIALILAGLGSTISAVDMDDNPITRFIKNMVNTIIGFINLVIKAFNNLGDVKFKGWSVAGVEILPSFEKKLWNIPEVPALAKGTVVPPNRAFLAMLGDNKTEEEVVSPLSTIRQAIKEELESEGFSLSNNSKEPIVLQLDGKTVAQLVWKEEDKRYKQYGSYAPI